MASDPSVQARGSGWRFKSRTHSKMVNLWYSFLKVHTLTTTHQKALILVPLIPCRVGFHSITANSWVHEILKFLIGSVESVVKYIYMEYIHLYSSVNTLYVRARTLDSFDVKPEWDFVSYP